MNENLLKKIKGRLDDNITWWVEGDTLFIENDGKQSEVYLDDLKNDFNKAINTILEEVGREDLIKEGYEFGGVEK